MNRLMSLIVISAFSMALVGCGSGKAVQVANHPCDEYLATKAGRIAAHDNDKPDFDYAKTHQCPEYIHDQIDTWYMNGYNSVKER